MASIFTETRPEAIASKAIHTLMGVRIVGTGSYVPPTVVRNSDLAALGCDEEWIVQRTGILERRRCIEGQATSDLALIAAEKCLKNSGVTAKEVDMIIVATMTPDHATPSAAAVLQSKLGAPAAAWDLNAACSGFMFALVTGAQFVKTGCAKNVLIIGADVMSGIVDPRDVKTYPLFGDGAGAVLMQADEAADGESKAGLLGYQIATVGELGHYITVPAGGSRSPITKEAIQDRLHYIDMNGRPVFKWAVRTVPRAVCELLRYTGLTLADMDLLLLHQANRRIIDAALEDIDISPDKVFINLDKYGNTSAASIPILLDEAIEQGLMTLHGQRILMCGFGAGLTWGSCIYQC